MYYYLSRRSSDVKHTTQKTTPPSDTPTMPASIHSVLTSVPPEGQSLKSKQALEWSRLLFKCIKPVGEPEFRLNGDIGVSGVFTIIHRFVCIHLWAYPFTSSASHLPTHTHAHTHTHTHTQQPTQSHSTST